MSQSKPIQGRPFPVELLDEMNKFMPLNGLIKCCQANWTLKELGILRAQKVHAKLISLYFADVSTLAIWFKQWARQVAEIRAKIRRQSFTRLETFVQTWWNLSAKEKAEPDVRFWQAYKLSQLADDFNEFYQLLVKISYKISDILEVDRVENILTRFNFPPAFQNELRQIRASHIEQALAPAKFELSQWRLENIPSWYEMINRFDGFLRKDFHEELNYCSQEFSQLNLHAENSENMLEMVADHLKRKS